MVMALRILGLFLVLALGVGTWLVLREEAASRDAPQGTTSERSAVDVRVADELAEPAVDPGPRREDGTAPSTETEAPEQAGALLAVRLLARESGAALPGVEIVLNPDAHGYHGYRGVTTDAEGRAELVAGPGGTHRLVVNPYGQTHVRRDEFLVPPLRAGDRREIELELVTQGDLRWFGRVLDDATGTPLAGARVTWLEGGPPTVPVAAFSAADGICALEFADWEEARVRVESPGYLPAEVALVRDHESVERACSLRLERPGRLDVRVRDPLGAPLGDVSVQLTPLAVGEPSLPMAAGSTDADGRCSLEDLPVRTSLDVVVRAGPGRTQRLSLVLAPGETRTLEFEVGRGCRVEGIAQDERGEPLSGLDLWRLTTDAPAHLVRESEHFVVDKARTDASGGFVFESVPAGDWWIGPRPGQRNELVPVATRVTITGGESLRALTLVCRSTRFIHGRVLSPEGKPAVALVTATQEGVSVSAQSRGDGRFSVGPLSSGEWWLEARALRRGVEAPSELVTAEAGQSDVLLRLRPGGRVTGTVLDEGGAPVAGAQVSLYPDERGRWATALSGKDGFFVFECKLADTYHLRASSGAYAATLGPILLGAGGRAERLELRLALGAELRIRLARGAPRGSLVRVVTNGAPLLLEDLAPGAELRATVPAGSVVVQLVHKQGVELFEVLAERRVDLRAGQTTVVELAEGTDR
jgi:carboxypeptidase family protein